MRSQLVASPPRARGASVVHRTCASQAGADSFPKAKLAIHLRAKYILWRVENDYIAQRPRQKGSRKQAKIGVKAVRQA